MTEYDRVLQSITEFYRVFLAHLLGPIFGLVFLYFSVKLKRNSGSHIPTTLKVARIIFGGFFEINNSRNFQEYIMYFEHTLKLVGASNTSCNKFREVETKTSKRRRHSVRFPCYESDRQFGQLPLEPSLHFFIHLWEIKLRWKHLDFYKPWCIDRGTSVHIPRWRSCLPRTRPGK